MRHDIHIFCYCVVGVTWKWHCNKPWCCLTLKAAFQEGRTAYNYKNQSMPWQCKEQAACIRKGCSGMNGRTFSATTSSPPYQGQTTRSCLQDLPLSTLFIHWCPCTVARPHRRLQPSHPLPLWTSQHLLPLAVPLDRFTGSTMQLCQSSQVPGSGFKDLSPVEDGWFIFLYLLKFIH